MAKTDKEIEDILQKTWTSSTQGEGRKAKKKKEEPRINLSFGTNVSKMSTVIGDTNASQSYLSKHSSSTNKPIDYSMSKAEYDSEWESVPGGGMKQRPIAKKERIEEEKKPVIKKRGFPSLAAGISFGLDRQKRKY